MLHCYFNNGRYNLIKDYLTLFHFCYEINEFSYSVLYCISLHELITEPLFKSFKLLKVADIFKLQQLKFYFNLINNKQPGYFNNFDFTQNHQLHHHYTRSSNNFHTPKIKHTFATKCLRFSLPTLLNNTPQCITDKYFTHSLDGFARYAKKIMINNYCYQCTIPDCYICNNN